MLKIENLYMKYNKKPVVKGVSLTVAPGEIHGLIGENSAGKTTLIKCAVGIYMPDQGTITYDDLPIYDNPAAKCKVGYVADSCPYIEAYSIKKTIKMYECFYEKFDKEKFNHFNEVFQLPVNKSISSLSKGQKMRLTFMLEVSKNPDYMVLDEPTSGLDPVAKKQFFDFLIREVEDRNIGVLISSHNLASLESLCDSITMIHDGTVERQLSMEEMKSELTRLNVVIEGGAPKSLYDMPEIMKISNVGSIYTIIVKDYNEGVVEKLRKNGASFIEAMDISLEELYVTLEESREKEINPEDYKA